jgi:nicotinate-nucleotide adenylyltransferase
MKRIGAYGGTFDPIHNAHLEIARSVTREFNLDRLFLIPAYAPPHKEASSVSSAFHRFAMAVLATLDEPRISVSTIELEAPDRPYTFETVERLRQETGAKNALYFVMGADSFEEMGDWRSPERILQAANLVVITRPGIVITRPGRSGLPGRLVDTSNVLDRRGGSASSIGESPEAPYGMIYLTDLVSDDVSSTEVRRRARNGEEIEPFVPARVADYVRRYELYRR